MTRISNRIALPAFALTLGVLAAEVSAQQGPLGGHAGSSGAGTEVSHNGSLTLGIDVALPPARGRVPVPFGITYNGSAGAGELGVGWSLSANHVRRTVDLTRTRPKFFIGDQAPEPIDRLYLTLNGTTMLMAPEFPGVYRPMVGSPGLTLLDDGYSGWLLHDGDGNTYAFREDPRLEDAGVWLLSNVNDTTGRNPVRYLYEIVDLPIGGGAVAKEVDLAAIEYNTHPSGDCAKHRVQLTYEQLNLAFDTPPQPLLDIIGSEATPDQPSGSATYAQGPLVPFAITAGLGGMAGRARVLTSIDILAHGSTCADASSRQRISGYRFGYERDADTGRPRLTSSDSVGRAGSEARLPIGRYEYGSMQGAALTTQPQVEPWPAELASDQRTIGLSEHTSWLVMDSPQLIADMTGDGRADVLFRTNDGLRMIRATNASSGALSGPHVSLQQASIPLGLDVPLASVSTVAVSPNLAPKPIYEHDVLSQLIDFNGDGRTDILHADEPDSWSLYLNMPASEFGGQPDEIRWDRRVLDVGSFRQELIARNLLEEDHEGPVPLSRKVSGNEWRKHSRAHWNGSSWQIAPGGFVAPRSSGRTVTLWKLMDVNGDSYPDLVASELSATLLASDESGEPLGGSGCDAEFPGNVETPSYAVEAHCDLYYRLELTADPHRNLLPRTDEINRLLVRYNRAGNQLFNGTVPFAAVTPLDGTPQCGVETWTSRAGVSDASGELRCGLIELNGDGIPDFVEPERRLIDEAWLPYARLGTGRGFVGEIALPGVPRQRATPGRCDLKDQNGEPIPVYPSGSTATYGDVTGDGIPDFVSGGEVRIGTGSIWLAPTPAFVGSGYSSQTDCTVERTTVSSGHYDFDGDGRLDRVAATPGGIEVSRVANITGVGAYDAGRLTAVGNGYGARMTVRYASAKNDIVARHDVPFAEIVVAETQLSTPDESLEPTRMAYGNSKSWFDAASDRWVATGFGRRVVVIGASSGEEESFSDVPDISGLPALRERVSGRATISDVNIATNGSLSYREFATHGRPVANHHLDGELPADPWELLRFDQNGDYSDKLHAQSITGWEALPRSGTFAQDCLSQRGYWLATTTPQIAPNSRWDWPCQMTGMGYPKHTSSWEGDASDAIRTGSVVRAVDAWGRPLLIEQQRDLKDDTSGGLDQNTAIDARTDRDNTCLEVAYANVRQYLLNTASEYIVRSCDGEHMQPTTLARMSLSFDDVGNVIRTTTYRYETTSGIEQDSISDRTSYDPYGNPLSHSRMADGVTRTTTSAEHDPFALVASRSTTYASGTGTPVIHASVVRDPVTLAVKRATDAHGSTATVEYDGFGRARSTGVIPAGVEAEYLLGEFQYYGYEVGETGPIFNLERAYPDVGSEPTEARTYLDPLGRMTHGERRLGSDYQEVIVSGETTYDRLGRPLFVADPYVAGEGDDPYGTTLHYRADGSLSCEVRGPGITPATTQTDEEQGIYPTCYTRSYRDQNLVMRAYGPEDLVNGLSDTGPYWEEVLTATGRVLERSRIDDTGARRELIRFGYDKLGSVLATKRYADPAAAANPVLWAFVRDSNGRALAVSEPSAATVHSSFDAFGNLLHTSWDDDAGTHKVEYAYDAFGRVLEEKQTINDLVLPNSTVTYTYDQASGEGATDPRWTHLLGRLASASNQAMTVQYGYDAFGQLTDVSRLADGLSYDESYAYRLDGQLSSITYRLPDTGHEPESALYEYDSAGRMRTVEWADASSTERVYHAEVIDAFGRPIELRFGSAEADNTIQRFEYRPDRRRELLNTSLEMPDGNMRGTVFSSYTPDLLVREKLDASISTNGSMKLESSRYSYDQLRRLDSAVVSDASGTLGGASRIERYRYDALGNLVGVDDQTGPNDMNLTMRSDDPDRICDEGVAALQQPGATFGGTDTTEEPASDGGFDVLPPPSSTTTIAVEAENGILAAPFAVEQDPTVSGGAYLTVPEAQLDNPYPNGGATVLYAIDVPEDGYYRLYGRVRASSGTSDSFFVHIDGEEARTWNVEQDPEWRVRRMTHSDGATETPIGALLTAGTHVLALRNREAGTSIDQIYLTTDAVNPPTDAIDPPTNTCGYRYDSLGNVVTVPSYGARPSRHFAYDGSGRISSMTSGDSQAHYVYGPEGDVMAFDMTTAGKPEDTREDRHFGPHVSRAILRDEDLSQSPVIERRIPGVPVARRGTGAGAEMLYSHGDAIGVRWVTNGIGEITQELSYRPFGGTVEDTGVPGGIHSSMVGFNGGNPLRAFGVIHIGARLYDPHTARFTQRDPLLATSSATMMNPYAFAWNDPINYNDRSGMYPDANLEAQWQQRGIDWNLVGLGMSLLDRDQGFLLYAQLMHASEDVRLELLREILQMQEVGRQAQALIKEMESTANLSAYESFISTVRLVDSITADGDPATDQVFFTIHQADAMAYEAVELYESDSWGERFMLYQRIQTRGSLVGLGALGLGKAFSGSAKAAGARTLTMDVGKVAVTRLAATGRKLSSLASRARASLTRVEQRLGACFAAGTLVETIDGPVPIEQLQPGDLVLSRDERTGEQTYQPVEHVFVREDVEILRLELQSDDGHTFVVDTTAEHPFWVTNVGWLDAAHLNAGDELTNPYGSTIRVARAIVTGQRATVFNLEVGALHTYFVGPRPVLVHNSCLSRSQREAIAKLRTGGTVYVNSAEEARELLRAMPELRPATQDRMLPNTTGRMADGFDDPIGTYRGDLINKQNPTGPVHPGVRNADHANFPHYNIRLWNGRKSAIIIKG